MGFLTVIIYVVLSTAVGALLVSLSLDLIEVSMVVDYLVQLMQSDYSLFSVRWIVMLSGVLLILMCLRYVQALWLRSRKDKSVRFESEEGSVSITLFAIEDMLRKMLEQKHEISHVRPKVFLRKKGLEIVARGVLMAEVNLVEFVRDLQEKVKEKMSAMLGEDKEVMVRLEIRKVSLGGKKETVNSEEPEVPFRNYE